MSSAPTDEDLDTVVESFASACRRGENPSVAEWVDRFPVHASKLRDLLPAVQLLERGNPQGPATPASGATPGFKDEEIPERIGEFKILKELGRGAMGVVFEAIEEPLGRNVALKVLPALHLGGPAEKARFQREAEVASRLSPHSQSRSPS